jgi:hypothetical protein
MDTKQLIEQIERIAKKAQPSNVVGAHAEAAEFLRVYAGPASEYLAALKSIHPRGHSREYVVQAISEILYAFRGYVEAGLHAQIPPERQAQLDVVSDFLDQAHQLLESKGVHPAAPTVLIGAALEEFLRTWIETEGLSIGNAKPGLDVYAKTLREADKITKQDYKDITAWAGLRNHGAHGEWAEVADKGRVSLMLEGVNLFMRKYGL